MKRQTHLYRHFDSSGALLYVGISCSAITRLSAHKQSEWFNRIATVAIKSFHTKESARQAELEAISKENPLFNRELKRRKLRKGALVRVRLYLPQNLYRQALASAALAGISLNQLIVELLRRRCDQTNN